MGVLYSIRPLHDLKQFQDAQTMEPKKGNQKHVPAVLPKLAANGSSQQMRQRVNGANKDVKPQWDILTILINFNNVHVI